MAGGDRDQIEIIAASASIAAISIAHPHSLRPARTRNPSNSNRPWRPTVRRRSLLLHHCSYHGYRGNTPAAGAALAGNTSLAAVEARSLVAAAGRNSLAAVDLADSTAGLVGYCCRRSSRGWTAVVARRCRVPRPCASGRDTEEVARPGRRLSVIRWQVVRSLESR